MDFIWSSVVAFVVSFSLTWYLATPNARIFILDQPNERSLHQIPVPRTGGVALVLALLGALALLSWRTPLPPGLWWFIMAFALVVAISLLDDYRGVAVAVRLPLHFLSAWLLWLGGFNLHDLALPGVVLELPALVDLIVTLLLIVWMINLYNFMDGMDGFAAGMAIFGFGGFSFLGFAHGAPILGALGAFAVAAAAGFLIFNFPLARIFLGDAGASSLGLWAAAFIVWGARAGVAPFWIGLLIFSPFWVDATWTLCRRALQGKRVWAAHREHFYQRLVQLGWGHRRTVLCEYVLMLACGVSGILLTEIHVCALQLSLALLWVAIYLGLAFTVRRLERVHAPARTP